MTPTETFISKAIAKHGDKYDYSKTLYIKSKSKVVITCTEHGDFEQIPNAHLTGQGCPKCGKTRQDDAKKLDTNSIFVKCADVHGDKYDYSRVEFVKVSDSVVIGCPDHGWFSQILINHYRGQGCPKCGKRRMASVQKMSLQDFIDRSMRVHGDRYDYSEVNIENYRSKVTIICKTHGSFIQSAENHYCNGAGCPKCANVDSKAETDIVEIIRNLGFECQTRNRTLIKPLELDIIIPSLKIAIEYNGLLWHSEKYGKDKWYHHDKSQKCAEKGYRLIHIWEDDWNRNKELQIQFLRHQLGVSKFVPIYARECDVIQVDKSEVKKFLDSYHVQGSTVFSESLCLSYKGEMVSTSCFTQRGDKYELVRHCTSKPVVGALGKSVKNFRKTCGTEIYTFLDKARFSGVSYEKAGFVKDGELPPDYMYFKGGRRYHKFNFRRKQIARLHPEVYSEELSESQMMELAGYVRIWDCGKIKFRC